MRTGALAIVLAVSACAARPPVVATTAATHAPVSATAHATVASNILRADYAGSKACSGCHPDEYDAFMAAPMHNMTRLPSAAVPSAPFDGGSFRFKDDQVRFETRGADRLMTIVSQSRGTRTFRVTRIIGGHYREDFAGVEVGAPGVPVDGKTERILPASWFLGTRSWRYKGYSVMGPERPGLRPGGVWNRTCIFCHNTIPYFDDLLGALSDPKLGPYQGEVVDPLLPAARRARFEVTDRAALHRAVADEERVLGVRTPALEAGDLLRATRARFEGSNLVEVGIGCESCHGGSLEHVKHNATLPSYEPRASFLRVTVPVAAGGSARAAAINRVCARCHQVLFTRYPWSWEGRARSAASPGGSNINSGEARDFLLGGCASAMTCTDCHDPHAHERPHAAELETRADAICVRCHTGLTTATAQRAHTHHDPAGAGGRCLACHMPKKNMSLDNRLGRYHRIASPTETAKVEGDRPLECALCHGDKSVESLVSTMEAWWKKSYDRAPLRALYGADLAHADPLVETLARGKPHEQAVALVLLGARGDKSVAPLVAAQLTHPIPILRYYAVATLEALLGAPAPLDVHANDDVIAAAAARWLAGAGLRPEAPRDHAAPAPGGDEE